MYMNEGDGIILSGYLYYITDKDEAEKILQEGFHAEHKERREDIGANVLIGMLNDFMDWTSILDGSLCFYSIYEYCRISRSGIDVTALECLVEDVNLYNAKHIDEAAFDGGHLAVKDKFDGIGLYFRDIGAMEYRIWSLSKVKAIRVLDSCYDDVYISFTDMSCGK